jgi:hypothetical protein
MFGQDSELGYPCERRRAAERALKVGGGRGKSKVGGE